MSDCSPLRHSVVTRAWDKLLERCQAAKLNPQSQGQTFLHCSQPHGTSMYSLHLLEISNQKDIYTDIIIMIRVKREHGAGRRAGA